MPYELKAVKLYLEEEYHDKAIARELGIEKSFLGKQNRIRGKGFYPERQSGSVGQF